MTTEEHENVKEHVRAAMAEAKRATKIVEALAKHLGYEMVQVQGLSDLFPRWEAHSSDEAQREAAAANLRELKSIAESLRVTAASGLIAFIPPPAPTPSEEEGESA